MNNIKITKNIDKANLITHSGTFHADEIFGTIILSKIIPEITIIRLPEITNTMELKDAIVFDIGGGKFDHHQIGGNGVRENGVKYAACGLIWKEYGRELLKKLNIEEIDYIFQYIDKNLIQFIDANDNGELPKLNTEYRNFHLSYIVGLFNPKWDENVGSDEKFMEALKLSEIIFDEFLKDTISKMKAKHKIEEAINKSEEGILILNEHMPWKEVLLESEIEKAKDINYVVFPSNRGGYNIYAVPIEIGSFENRKTMPTKWRGLKEKDLQNVTGIKTATFCHNAGFIATCKLKEDAIMFAKLACKS